MDEPYDHKNWWHSTVNMLGGFNCRDCDAFRPWNAEMAGCPENDDDEFLRRCVSVAQHAKAESWTIVEAEANLLCPRCSAARLIRRSGWLDEKLLELTGPLKRTLREPTE